MSKALNLARLQGRYAVTPHGGARVGSRGRRFVTSVPGRLWAEASGRHYDRPAGLRLPPLYWRWQGPGNTRSCVAPSQEVRETGTELWRSFAAASAVVERREASARRSARAASRRVRPWTTRLSAFRFLPCFLTSWLEAQIVRCRCPPPASSGEDRCEERGFRGFICCA